MKNHLEEQFVETVLARPVPECILSLQIELELSRGNAMTTAKCLLIAGVSSLVSSVIGYQWHAVPLSHVHAEGILQYEEPVHPAVTPTYPPGYYVMGRIYLDGGSAEMVGKRVLTSGALTVQTHPETSSYPRITTIKLMSLDAPSRPSSDPLQP